MNKKMAHLQFNDDFEFTIKGTQVANSSTIVVPVTINTRKPSGVDQHVWFVQNNVRQ